MKLKTARERAGLTQAELAARAGCDQTQISRLEIGRVLDPSHRIVVRICRVLGVEPDSINEFRVNGK